MTTFIFEFLQSPYDTNCNVYAISQSKCYFNCIDRFSNNHNAISRSRHANGKCSNHCIKKDCIILLFNSFLSMNPNTSVFTAAFSKECIGMKSTPFYGIIFFIQQIIGLVVMFFDIAIIDARTLIIKLSIILRQKLRNSKTIFITRKQARRWKRRMRNVKNILFSLIVTCCITHCGISIGYYLQYKTSTETYIGTPLSISMPYTGLCTDNEYISEHVHSFNESYGIRYIGYSKYETSNILLYIGNATQLNQF